MTLEQFKAAQKKEHEKVWDDKTYWEWMDKDWKFYGISEEEYNSHMRNG